MRQSVAFWLTFLVFFAIGGVVFIFLRQPPEREFFPAREILVQPGDTLWSIAVKAVPEKDPRETVDWICRANRLTTLTIRPGQRLVIPKVVKIKKNEIAHVDNYAKRGREN